MSTKKHPSLQVSPAVYEEMSQYASLYGLTLSDLVTRMWTLWRDIEKTRAGLMPLFPPLQEPLETFLAEMEEQAINLDEEYTGAIETYQKEHPFIPDSDETPVICPHCKRETIKADLLYLPGEQVQCTNCYTLPRILQEHKEQ